VRPFLRQSVATSHHFRPLRIHAGVNLSTGYLILFGGPWQRSLYPIDLPNQSVSRPAGDSVSIDCQFPNRTKRGGVDAYIAKKINKMPLGESRGTEYVGRHRGLRQIEPCFVCSQIRNYRGFA
jgi:hypothetical protein